MHIDNNADIPCGHRFTVMTQTAREDMRARTINNTRTLKTCFQLILYAYETG